MRPEITAEWARKTAEEVLNEKVKKQINLCLDKIQEAVKENKLSVNIYNDVDELAITELKRRGFKTNRITGGYGNLDDSIKITW